MNEALCAGAERMRLLLASGQASPAAFRAALTEVPPAHRDAWLDRLLGIDELPDDGADLPRGCAPYMPCPVDTLLRAVDYAEVEPTDVFVDVGAGLGRAATLTHFLTGAAAIALEIQPQLARAARALADSLNASRVAVIEGDAARLTGAITIGSVFFLYCPFSGPRLHQVLDDLETVGRTRQIRVCCVDLPLPRLAWLELTLSSPAGDLSIYRSTPVSSLAR